MSSLEELIAKAKNLHTDGHSPGHIADELNLSMETVTWLLTQEKGVEAPRDVHIDWISVSSRADMLKDISLLLLKLFLYANLEDKGVIEEQDDPTAVIGISHSGVPLATFIAAEYDARMTIYHPAKHAGGEKPVGSLSANFAPITGERCLIVDDVITSGRTMKEVVGFLRSSGAQPLGICVIFDKRGLQEVDGVPVYSLFKISRID